jgi:hypothetical protein
LFVIKEVYIYSRRSKILNLKNLFEKCYGIFRQKRNLLYYFGSGSQQANNFGFEYITLYKRKGAVPVPVTVCI